MSIETVAFVGLGNMGTPMAAACMRAGLSVVGFDPQPAARDRLVEAGGTAYESAAEAAQAADLVVLMLPNSNVVESVVDEITATLRSDTLLVDMSSSEPLRTRALAERLAASGIRLIDAPVSGGVRRAETGSLTIMVGGDPSDIERAQPALTAMGNPTAVGSVGAGHALKALNNLLSATHLLSVAEAMLAGERFGLDPGVMLSVFNSSSGRSGSTESKWPDFVLTDRYDSGFALALMVKDMGIAVDLVRAVDGPHELSERALEEWRQAQGDLPAQADHTEIARWVRSRADDHSTAGSQA